MTHTPGPYDYAKLGNNADQWGIDDENGRTIGLSYHGEDNARLFAAAPDLLAACEAYRARYHPFGPPSDGQQLIYTLICAAITKATSSPATAA